MIKVGIVGISGYSGKEALTILLRHPEVRVTYVSANNTTGAVGEIWPQMAHLTDLICNKYDPQQAGEHCDVLVLAVPHTVAMSLVPGLLEQGKKVIDLSADYRLASAAEYQKWYQTEHRDGAHLNQAVYGLPEIYREKIKTATLIANPGCYPTAALLGLAPLAGLRSESLRTIIIDAKSGVSGAGKKSASALMFAEANENFRAYKVLRHQHTPEIEQYLSQIAERPLSINFVPHLLPVNRGILETIYVRSDQLPPLQELQTVYHNFYKKEPFVRILPPGQQPELKNVNHTNFCDIGLALNEQKDILVITAAIDNLVKGAAGQAVQNMNIMCHFDEKMGLQS